MSSDQTPIKIAVYAISLNEEKHVLRWWESAREADLVLLVDTGSTDRTVDVASELGIQVERIHISPWRFDIGRNTAMSLLPADIDMCVAIDLDEVLQPNWREVVERGYLLGLRWMSFKMVTAQNTDGSAKSYFLQNKIHPRNGFSWRYLIHEFLVFNGEERIQKGTLDLEVHHLWDKEKSRDQYLQLLVRNLAEFPSEFHAHHLLIREYFKRKDFLSVYRSTLEALKYGKDKSLTLAMVYRWGSEAAFNLKFPEIAVRWAKKSCSTVDNFYENWLWYAKVEWHAGNHKKSLKYSSKLHSLPRLQNAYSDPNAWEWDGFSWIASNHFKLQNYKEAVHFGFKAHQGRPDSRQFQENLEVYTNYLNRDLVKKRNTEASTSLIDFPPIFWITLNHEYERQQLFHQNCRKFDLNNTHQVKAVAAQGNSKKDFFAAISQSHLNAIEEFYARCESEWAVICEDDVSFDLSELWPFDWREKFSEIKRLGIDILQMSCIVADSNTFLSILHKRRPGVDWSTGIYLLSRKGAELILFESKRRNLFDYATESFLLDGLDVYTEALFTCDAVLKSSRDQSHIDAYHIPSWNKIRSYYEGLWLQGA